MKKFYFLFYYLSFTLIFVSCTSLSQKSGGTGGLIQPGDKIGKMILEQGDPLLPYPYLWQFCEYMPDNHEPTTSSNDCKVPQMSGLTIAFGWIAKESKLPFNWDAIDWDLNIDGQSIDLVAFKWQESDYIAHGEDNKSRQWLIDLKNLSPGGHTLQLMQTIKTAVDDGFNVYQPGNYEHSVNFTVTEKTEYATLTSKPYTGQHTYTSKSAGLDFLLYLPNDYGKDSQKQWPLLIYLHGAPLRGTTLELLKKEPLPKKLENDSNFPFVVVSPLGDGGFEFWSKEDMIKPLFKLLDEIRKKYSIDSTKIYLTGNDMGGNGVWSLGLNRPEYFAALAPVAGYAMYPFEIPENICDLKNVPVWAFHGERDSYVPYEVQQNLVNALNTCGGNAQFTIIPEMKNDVPYEVYANQELYDWFLVNSRK
jgi:predicted esterase